MDGFAAKPELGRRPCEARLTAGGRGVGAAFFPSWKPPKRIDSISRMITRITSNSRHPAGPRTRQRRAVGRDGLPQPLATASSYPPDRT